MPSSDLGNFLPVTSRLEFKLDRIARDGVESWRVRLCTRGGEAFLQPPARATLEFRPDSNLGTQFSRRYSGAMVDDDAC